MLNTRDLERMASDVGEIRTDWAVSVHIKTPKPESEQSGWNSLMRESTTGLEYYEQSGVQVEVRRRAREQQLNIDVAGDKLEDSLMLFVSPTYTDDGVVKDTIVTDESLFTLSDREGTWRVRSIRPQIGEIMVEVMKLVG